MASSTTTQASVDSARGPASAKRAVWARIAATIAFFAGFEGLLFHSGFYTQFLHPDSTTGYMETQLRNEIRRPKQDHNQVLAVGHSRMAFSPRVANEEMKPATGYTFATIAIGGSTPRMWYYSLRAVDPEARNYAAILIPEDDYNEPETWDYQSERESDLHYMAARMELKDLADFPWTFQEKKLQWRMVREMLLRGTVYKQDFLDLLKQPEARVALARLNDRVSAESHYNFQGTQDNLNGIQIDWEHKTIQYPPGISAAVRKNIEDQLLGTRPPLEPGKEGRQTAYLRYWYGRILDYYRGSNTKLIFLRVPRAPAPPPDTLFQAASAVRQIAKRPNVIVLDESLFNQLEHPDLFFDGWHLNRAGREEFSRILAGEVRRALGPPKT